MGAGERRDTVWTRSLLVEGEISSNGIASRAPGESSGAMFRSALSSAGGDASVHTIGRLKQAAAITAHTIRFRETNAVGAALGKVGDRSIEAD
jgi:hypothetical protein